MLDPASLWTKTYSASRRFDVLTVLIVTSAYAALLGVWRLTGFPWAPFVIFTGWLVAIGLGEAILEGRIDPRHASIMFGTPYLVVLVSMSMFPQDIPTALPWTVLLSAAASYVGGTFVGGLFLLLDVVRNFCSQKK